MSHDQIKNAIKLYQNKKYSEALQVLLKIENNDDRLMYYLGLCYTHLRQWDKASYFLEEALLTIDQPLMLYQCRLSLSYIYIQQKKPELSVAILKMLIDDGFESAQVYSSLAYAEWSLKKIDKAIASYKQALKYDPENATALNSLGYILADQNKDLTQALVYCKKALSKYPQNPAYMDSLGWIYYKSGLLKDAALWLLKAQDQEPHNPLIQNHLAIINKERMQ